MKKTFKNVVLWRYVYINKLEIFLDKKMKFLKINFY